MEISLREAESERIEVITAEATKETRFAKPHLKKPDYISSKIKNINKSKLMLQA